MDEWVWIVIIVLCGLAILGLLGWTYDGTIRKRIRTEVGSRLRERADTFRDQANTLGWGDGHDQPPTLVADDCEDCGDDDDE